MLGARVCCQSSITAAWRISYKIAGFFGSSSIAASASAAPSSSSANQDSEVGPQLRRMSKLVPGFQIVWPSITQGLQQVFGFWDLLRVFQGNLRGRKGLNNYLG